jgi:two-component system phosphate regulon sensor histidine kinase PhoR
VVLMSISLIGIITVQLYWINNAVESKKAQFKNDVFKALASTADRIQAGRRINYMKITKIFLKILPLQTKQS